MKILLLMLVVFSSGNPAYSQQSENDQLEQSCAGQLMSLASTANMDKTGTFKKTVYSKSIDKKFVGLFNDMKKLVDKVQSAGKNDQASTDKMRAIYTKVTNLARKEAAKPLGVCINHLNLLSAQMKVTCPELKGTEANYPELVNSCAEKAMKEPGVAASFEEWKNTQKALVLASAPKPSK